MRAPMAMASFSRCTASRRWCMRTLRSSSANAASAACVRCASPACERLPARRAFFMSRSVSRDIDPASHAAAVLAADLEQRIRDLPERAHAHRLHQHLEDVGVGYHRLLQALQHRARLGGMALPEITQAGQLALLLLVGGACELERLGHRVAMRVAEGVDAD